jgi:hypothetical protein
MGAVLGSAIQLGLNYHSTLNNLSNGTYIAFLILAVIGAFVPLFLVRPLSLNFEADHSFLTLYVGRPTDHASCRRHPSAHACSSE